MPRVLYPKLQDVVWLRREYEERLRSTTEIAIEVGCQAATVSSALHKHGIKMRPRNAPHGANCRRRVRVRRDVISQKAIDRQSELKHAEEFSVRLKEVVLAQRRGDPVALRRALIRMAALSEAWARLLPQKRSEVVALRPKRKKAERVDPYAPVLSHQIPTPAGKQCECVSGLPDEEGICIKCGGR